MTQTYRSADEAIQAQRDIAIRTLEQVLTHLEPLDPGQVDRYLRDDVAGCTLDAPPALSLLRRTRFEMDDPAAAAERLRIAVEADGWVRVETPGSEETSSTHRREDFLLTIAPSQDTWLNVGVESPCFAPDGTRIS